MQEVEEAIESDFLEAGRGAYRDGSGGWKMAAVSKPRGSTFEDAKLKFNEVDQVIKAKSGTVVFNSAGGFIPQLAGVCLQCTNAFDLPCAINMYLTAAGQELSAPPHTDKQDVFVLQTQGQKHWRVYSPPPPSRMPRADPFARGKGTDHLSLSELDAPLLDVVLSPGQVLYIPAGFPHTTDTIYGITDGDPSVHLTVGIDTHIWGLNYASLRGNLLKKIGIDDKLVITKLDDPLYWDLQSALPLGFLGTDLDDESKKSIIQETLFQKCKDVDSNFERPYEDVKPIVTNLLKHHRELTDILGRMYADVCMKISPATMDLSFFRSKVTYIYYFVVSSVLTFKIIRCILSRILKCWINKCQIILCGIHKNK